MSLEFTSLLEKPSNLIPLPNRFLRPAFEELYGFDAVVDGAIFTEASEPLTTEQDEILLFEPEA
jgi:hypothetical protein